MLALALAVGAVVFVVGGAIVPAFFPWPSALYLYLTEAQFEAVKAHGRLGLGWRGWLAVF